SASAARPPRSFKPADASGLSFGDVCRQIPERACRSIKVAWRRPALAVGVSSPADEPGGHDGEELELRINRLALWGAGKSVRRSTVSLPRREHSASFPPVSSQAVILWIPDGFPENVGGDTIGHHQHLETLAGPRERRLDVGECERLADLVPECATRR